MKKSIALFLLFGSIANAFQGDSSVRSRMTETVQDSFGNFYKVTYEVADTYCSKQSMRIPTAREFAQFSQELGAKGILETKYPNTSVSNFNVKLEIYWNYKNNFVPIYKKTLDGTVVVDFYFNNSGYKFDSPETKQAIDIWTSSLEPSPVSEKVPPENLVWVSNDGHLTTRTENLHSIRCLRD